MIKLGNKFMWVVVDYLFPDVLPSRLMATFHKKFISANINNASAEVYVSGSKKQRGHYCKIYWRSHYRISWLLCLFKFISLQGPVQISIIIASFDVDIYLLHIIRETNKEEEFFQT